MVILPRLKTFLEDNNISYRHHLHPATFTARELAHAEHVPEHKVAKVVVFYGDNGYGMAVLPADHLVDLQELRMLLGLSHARLATEEEMAALFPDCELGAEPPFGSLYGIPVYLDAGLMSEEEIAFMAGTHRDVLYLQLKDYQRVVSAAVMAFARQAVA